MSGYCGDVGGTRGKMRLIEENRMLTLEMHQEFESQLFLAEKDAFPNCCNYLGVKTISNHRECFSNSHDFLLEDFESKQWN